MKSKNLFSLTVVFIAILLATQAYAAGCDWKPTRAVTFMVPWGAGGGADANSRMIATLLSKRFGVPFNVVNRTGGNGVTGHTAIAKAKPDGYTIGMATIEIATMHWVGLTNITYKNISPIALVAMVPAGVTVKKDSPFKSLGELLDYAKKNPGKLTGSGTAQGGIWHLALAGMLISEGLPADTIRWVPSKGAGPAIKELMAGGVDVVTVGLSESKSLIEQGELVGLAYMHEERMSALPDIPTTVEVLPNDWTLAAYMFLSGPEGLPHNIACSYEAAVKEAFTSKEWADFKASRGDEVVYLGIEDMNATLKKSDTNLGKAIKEIGLAK